MAHFAELNENNEVLRVIVVDNENLLDDNGNESEQKGLEFISTIFEGRFIQTSRNCNFRKQFAGVGSIYDEQRDAFITKQPHPSWILDEETCLWVAPIERPEGHGFIWNEEDKSWKQVPFGYEEEI